MTEDNVIDIETKRENVEDEFPLAQFGYIDTVASQIFGDDIGYNISPAKTETGEKVIVMYIGSLKYKEIIRKVVFDLEDLSETRKACIVMAYEIYAQETKFDNTAGGKLIVPEKGLIIPTGI